MLNRLLSLVLSLCLLFCAIGTVLGEEWKSDGFVNTRFTVSGTGDRNNPLRRQFDEPFDGDELFVRMRLRYDAKTLDTPVDGDGEFFVLWLDSVEGTPGSTHSAGVPNIGIHTLENENRFMIRYQSSGQKFGPALEGDREYLVVARIWKSKPGPNDPFDKLDLWVDPANDAENSPVASVSDSKALKVVSWMGFSTGRKTEFGDRIEVHDIATAATWHEILKLPPPVEPVEPVLPPPIVKTVAFVDDVLPVLKKHCFECHAGDDPDSGMRLDVLDEMVNQTAPRDAAASHLYQLLVQGEMPPEKKQPLTKPELDIIAAWINEGMEWDETLLPTPIPESTHWAFQPVVRPEIPHVKNGDWIRTPVDAFIAAKHEEVGLVPNPAADTATLNRRLSLDMLGLPAAQGADPLDVDVLLENPAYGERWGRHWLDVARWAESNGHQHNRERKYAWPYRDWVINAFNSGMPFDQFLRDQIAGDEVRPFSSDQLVATGFLAAARYSGNELDKEIQRNDILTDVTNTTASAFLGLTMECAQCHTHKFDPISIRDYYRFQAFFASGQPGNAALEQNPKVASAVAERWAIFDSVQARMERVKRKQGVPDPIYITPKSVVGGMKAEEKAQFTALEQQIESVPQAWCFVAPAGDSGQVTVTPHDMRWPLPRQSSAPSDAQTFLLIRGDVKSKGPAVSPDWPLVLGGGQSDAANSRLQLAEWMTSPENPLTARVWVNRIWQWHFGTGLVETSSDFGTQGTPPTHPELLDFLANELMQHNWDTNHIHRLILNSATYRQSNRFSAANAAIDPDNLLLWRWTPRRLEAEAIRDSILQVSGQLDREVGGVSVAHDSLRRSIYLKQQRERLPDQQNLFDGVNAASSCSRRRTSTSALQPLWLLNNEFAQEAAGQMAQRSSNVVEAFQTALLRLPTDLELEQLTQLADEHGMQSACLVILNSSEFLYLP
ncbi:MAG: PSD1 and planctomycete cytochrome C domain-containing protein [Planctomycetaceae bacterium]